MYHSEPVHGNKAFKMPSDGYYNIDIYAETDIEMYKKLFCTRYSYCIGCISPTTYNSFLRCKFGCFIILEIIYMYYLPVKVVKSAVDPLV